MKGSRLRRVSFLTGEGEFLEGWVSVGRGAAGGLLGGVMRKGLSLG